MDEAQAKSKTRDLIDTFFSYVNKTLLIFKLFYFFFFAAFGSLFPLIAVYFKQIGMNAIQSSILVGGRPLIELFSAPFCGGLAEKWKKGRLFIFLSLLSWIGFTLGLSFVKPTPGGCLVRINGTTQEVLKPGKTSRERLVDEAHLSFSTYKIGQSPIALDYGKVTNKDSEKDSGLVIPMYSTIVLEQDKINRTFIILLFLILVGEFFSAPATTLADTAVLTYLGDDYQNFGRQRMFGSVGWGLAMFFIGISLDQSTSFPDHPCGYAGKQEKNYVICFATFTVFMLCAMLAATQFSFSYEGGQESMYLKIVKDKVSEKVLGRKSKERHKLVNEDDSDDDGLRTTKPQTDDDILERQLQIKLDVKENKQVTDDPDFDARTDRSYFDFRKWWCALKLFATPNLAAFLFVVWFMGCGVGFVFTFLFWHLQDIGGTPTLFGLASVINHISEILALYFGAKLLNTVGHVRVLYLGLVGNVVRFLFVSWLKNPWWVLPFEFIQGLTHAAVWSACCSFINIRFPKEFRSSSQGLMQGVHHGLGKGLGSLVGGIIISYHGSAVAFRAYGVTSVVILMGYVIMNYFMGEKDMAAEDTGDDNYMTTKSIGGENEKEYSEEASYLAPHGVPLAPSLNEISKSGNQLGNASAGAASYGGAQTYSSQRGDYGIK